MRLLLLAAIFQVAPSEEDLIAREKRKIAKHEETLKRDPSDRAASSVVGSFLCLVAGNWDAGLRLLAQGSDKPLSAAAAQDLDASSLDFSAWVSVGELWWEIGTKRTGIEARNAAGRAAHWWRRALPKLDKAGRARIAPKVEKWLKARGPFKVKVPANQARTDSGIDIFEGEKAKLQASGKWCINENPDREAWCDFRGYEHMKSKLVPMPDEPVCALLGRIGENVPFSVHRTPIAEPATSGRLWFGPNASPSENIPGLMIVEVEIQINR